jgi:hypothetical protein
MIDSRFFFNSFLMAFAPFFPPTDAKTWYAEKRLEIELIESELGYGLGLRLGIVKGARETEGTFQAILLL